MATPRAAAKRSGSSRGKWFFMGIRRIHETKSSQIQSLQILKPFTEFFEVGHPFSAHILRIRHGSGNWFLHTSCRETISSLKKPFFESGANGRKRFCA